MFYILFALMLLIQVADVWSSYNLIEKGNREKNPVVRYFINKLDTMKGLLVPKIFFVVPALVILVCFRTHSYSTLALAIGDLFYLMILLNYNFRR